MLHFGLGRIDANVGLRRISADHELGALSDYAAARTPRARHRRHDWNSAGMPRNNTAQSSSEDAR